MALFTTRILPNINKKLQMMRKSCVGTQTKKETEMRGGAGLIQFTTKGDTKSNSVLKKR
jgi:hypothetical protein